MSLATDMRDAYIAAELAILQGKTTSMGGRLLTLEDLDDVRKGRMEWERRAAAELAGGAGTAGGLGYAVATFGNRA